MNPAPPPARRVVVIVSADFEWSVVGGLFPAAERSSSPFGDWFTAALRVGDRDEAVLFFQGGWGKIAAAASTQYAIDRWSPTLLVNIGTCGGFEGAIEKGTVILAERTLVYDIVEQMGDYDAHVAHYATTLDLAWLGEPYPHPVRRTLLVSGDRDLIAGDIPTLQARYGAVAGDWESGAIAWVAARNRTRCLILRGVSDLVGPGGGEAYAGNVAVWRRNAEEILERLIRQLPGWIAAG